MKLVKAQPEDFEAIQEHYFHLIDHTPNMDKYAQWKKGLHPTAAGIREYIENAALYLLMDKGQIAGAMAVTMAQGADYHAVSWATAAKDDEVAVVHILGISPEYQGKGIGGQMIDKAIRLTKAHHKKAVRLDAVSTNVPAQHLYTAKGFVYQGKQHLYADNTGWIDFYYYEYSL